MCASTCPQVCLGARLTSGRCSPVGRVCFPPLQGPLCPDPTLVLPPPSAWLSSTGSTVIPGSQCAWRGCGSWRRSARPGALLPSSLTALPPGLCHLHAHARFSALRLFTCPPTFQATGWSWSPGSGYTQPFKVERPLVLFLLPRWLWSGVERATLVCKHTFAVVRTLNKVC